MQTSIEIDPALRGVVVKCVQDFVYTNSTTSLCQEYYVESFKLIQAAEDWFSTKSDKSLRSWALRGIQFYMSFEVEDWLVREYRDGLATYEEADYQFAILKGNGTAIDSSTYSAPMVAKVT